MNLAALLQHIRRAPRRLTVRLSLLLATLLCLAILLQGWINAQAQTSRMESFVRASVSTLTDSIATTVLPFMIVDDLSGLEFQLLEYATLHGTRSIRVLDAAGRIRSFVIHEPGRSPRPDYRLQQPEFPQPPTNRILMLDDQGDLQSWTPIMSGNERLGWVVLTYSLEQVRAIGPRILREAAVLALLAIGISLSLLFLYLRRPLRAIHAASDFAAKLNTRRGELIPVGAETEEVEKLQQALNFASRQLWEEHRALLESGEHLEAVLTHTADGIMTVGEDGTILSLNPAAERIFSESNAALQGRPLETLIPDWRRVPQGRRQETRGQHHTDGAFPLELTLSPMWIGDRHLYTATVRDLSETKRLEQLSSRLGRILEHSSNEIYIFDAETFRFVQVSEGALANLGYSAEELRQLTPLDLQAGMTRDQFVSLVQPLLHGREPLVQFEAMHKRKDGSLYPVEVRLHLSRTEEPPVFVAINQDITVRKHAEARLVYLANYDTLTDLPNRVLLHQRLARAVEEAEHNERLVAVLFIDLDRFKVINDTLGHDTGDELLKVVARRLTDAVRPGDTVARYGGDEFVTVLANVAHIDDVTKVAHKILGKLSPGITIGGRELFVTPSIGITLFPFDDRKGESLLRNADTAMFHAKEHGGNTFQFFTAELNERVQRRLAIETSLRHALERDEFTLHYQPQVDIASGEILAAEALLRWNHPEWGMVLPSEFIPLAEETGLILPIGEWVLRQACTQAQAWHAAGHRQLRMAVNLSGRQLSQKTLVDLVRQVLDECRLAHGLLELEITESLLMQDLEQTAATLDQLTELGVTVAMDDFGIGYSSLSYLKRLPIDAIKIDQSFVRDIISDPDDAAIVQAIIAMAHSLGLKVVAEGVETTEQLAFLKLRNCDGLQGYFISKPLPPDQFAALLKSSPPTRVALRKP